MPLSLRVVAIVVVLLVGLLALVGGLTLRLTRDHLERQLDRRLTAAVDSFETGPGARVTAPESLESETRAWLAAQATPSDEVVAVRTATGAVLTSVGGIDLRDIDGWSELVASDESGWSTIDGPAGSVRVLTVPIVLGDQPAGTILVAAEQASVDSTVDTLARSVLLAGVVGLLLATVLGLGLIRRTLRPLARMAGAVDDVQASGDLSRRVEREGPDDEVGHLADAFNRMMDSLEESFQSQQRFVSDAAHELRTPLTVARGHLELRDGQDAAVAEIDRMAHIVEDLLLLARLDEGIPLQEEAVEVELVLEEARLRAERVGARKVEVDAEAASLFVLADHARLLQVVTNLAANAVRHAGVDTPLRLSAHWAREQVVIEVSDRGPGIPPADLPHVFERFYRGRSQNGEAAAGGAGLGLPIVASLTRAMGGDVDVRSTPGVGTTFTVTLPAAPVP